MIGCLANEWVDGSGIEVKKRGMDGRPDLGGREKLGRFSDLIRDYGVELWSFDRNFRSQIKSEDLFDKGLDLRPGDMGSQSVRTQNCPLEQFSQAE